MKRAPFSRVLLTVFGSTLTIQILAFLRHMVIAAAYGVSRELDVYTLVNMVATIVVFGFASIFDNVSIPRLTVLHSQDNEAEFKLLAGRILGFSIVASLAVSLVFLLAVPLLSPAIGAGLRPEERIAMQTLSWPFLLWTFCGIPYYALCSFYKSRWRFKRVFGAEVLITASSLLSLLSWHDRIEQLPLAYGAGYLLGLLSLLPNAGVSCRMPVWRHEDMRRFYRNLLELFGANQVGNLAAVVERFLLSHLQQGALSAYSYAGLIVNNTSSLLSFREIFIVPLSEPAQREQRLERILIGLSLLAIPAGACLSTFAEPVIRILFERGRFDARAVAMSAELLQLYALALWPAMLTAPMERLFQVLDRIKLTAWKYVVTSVTTLLVGVVLVLWLHMGLRGFVLTLVVSCYLTMFSVAVLLSYCRIRIRWSYLARYVLFACLVAGVASYLSIKVGIGGQLLWQTIAGGCVFWGVIGAGYLIIHRQIRAVIR